MSTDADVRRIALAWRELRRGAAGAALRAHLVGPDGRQLQQAQLDALEVLVADADGWRMSEFADALHVDPSTATRAIIRLERMGLAERSTGGHDRRVVTARATVAGRDTVKRIAELRSIGMHRLLESFDADERREFADYLDRFVDAMNALVAELGHER